MSWHGKQYQGAMRDHQACKRAEAEERNARYQARQQAKELVDDHAKEDS